MTKVSNANIYKTYILHKINTIAASNIEWFHLKNNMASYRYVTSVNNYSLFCNNRLHKTIYIKFPSNTSLLLCFESKGVAKSEFRFFLKLRYLLL